MKIREGLAFGGVAVVGLSWAISSLAQVGQSHRQGLSQKESLESSLIREKVIVHQDKRDVLWTGLDKAWKKSFGRSAQDIGNYAENAALTELCFVRGSDVFLYRTSDGAIERILMAKVLPRINAMTFVKSGDSEKFVLWNSGKPEASIDAER